MDNELVDNITCRVVRILCICLCWVSLAIMLTNAALDYCAIGGDDCARDGFHGNSASRNIPHKLYRDGDGYLPADKLPALCIQLHGYAV